MNDVLKSPEISIVVPLYNEEKNIRLMYDRLVSSILKITSNFEIIYVNDGSKDNSFLELVKLSKEDERVKST
jgi:polyisoprenyl-phosphate glycosyltransferase